MMLAANPRQAKDGRQRKPQCHVKVDDIFAQVLKTKDGNLTPVDVIKMAANIKELLWW